MLGVIMPPPPPPLPATKHKGSGGIMESPVRVFVCPSVCVYGICPDIIIFRAAEPFVSNVCRVAHDDEPE